MSETGSYEVRKPETFESDYDKWSLAVVTDPSVKALFDEMGRRFESTDNPYETAVGTGQSEDVGLTARFDPTGTCVELWLSYPPAKIAILIKNPDATNGNGNKDLIGVQSVPSANGDTQPLSLEEGIAGLREDPESRLRTEVFVRVAAENFALSRGLAPQ